MRIKWDIEEMIALVDIFFLYKYGKITDLDRELTKLSLVLIRRADMLGIKHDEKYRNANVIRMIFANIQYVDSKGKEGMSGAGAIVYYAYYMYKVDRVRFREILDEFESKYR